jgi:outer membrane cobalamin receptor
MKKDLTEKNRKCFKGIIFGLVLNMIFILNLFSEEEKSNKAIDLGEMVITATRTEHSLDDVPTNISVLTEKDIEKIYPQDTGDFLNQISSIKLERYAGIGSTSNILFRGLLSAHTLVLIDGRPVNAPSTGSADLSWLSTQDIDKIEVVKGPYSALYGTNAVAGVINIITKDIPDSLETKLDFSGGSWKTFKTYIKNGNNFERWGYVISGEYKTSEGERDNSKYYTDDIFGKIKCRIGENSLTTSFGYNKDSLGNPGVKPSLDPANRFLSQTILGNENVSSLFDYGKNEREFINSVLDGGNYRIETFINHWDSNDHREWIIQDWMTSINHRYIGTDNFITRTRGLKGQYSWNIGEKNILTGGIEYQEDKFSPDKQELDTYTSIKTVTKQNNTRRTKTFFLQNEFNLEKIILVLGLRMDDPSDYSSETSYKTNLLYNINNSTKLRVAYGEAFRAPSLNGLYWPETDFAIGNPNLRPEKSNNYEIGLEKIFSSKSVAKLSLFRQKVDNMIAWQPTGPIGIYGNKWQPVNSNSLKTEGIEIDSGYHFTEKIGINISYSYLDSIQKNMELVDDLTKELREFIRRAAYIPRHMFRLNLSYKDIAGIKGFSLNTKATFVDDTYCYYTNWSAWPAVSTDEKQEKNYITIDLKLSRKINNKEFYLVINNLFDEYYAKFGGDINDEGYPQPGRAIYLGIKYKF